MQILDTFIRAVVTKLVPVLRVDSFKSYSIDCSAVNGTIDSSAMSSSPNAFETRLVESFGTTPLIQFYQNSTFNVDYYLKMMVFGRDGNNLKLMHDESPVLTELGMIDNAGFSVASNISLKAPRRFFRIGVSQVTKFSRFKKKKINKLIVTLM